MWILLEGLDRSGKSSVAEYYKSKGYHYVHMNAPDKKYSGKGYAGPGYIDEMLALYTTCDGRDVVFDRSIWGEKIWPAVFARNPQLSYDDFEALQDFEKKNKAEYVLMWDQDFDAHWKRCHDDGEPLNRGQFNHAIAMYERLEGYGFIKKSLPDFKGVAALAKTMAADEAAKNETETDKSNDHATAAESVKNTTNVASSSTQATIDGKSPQQHKLEKANAIDTLLASRILKRKGLAFDDLESDIRDFLQDKLNNIFNKSNNNEFTDEEKQVLKLYATRILKKHKEK